MSERVFAPKQSNRREWSAEEEQLLRDNCESMTLNELREKFFPYRSRESLLGKFAMEGLHYKRKPRVETGLAYDNTPWTQEEDAPLRERYIELPVKEVLKLFPHRKREALVAHAHKLGLYKPKRVGKSEDERRKYMREHARIMRATNPEMNQRVNEYYRQNPHKRNAINHRYRAKLTETFCDLTAIQELFIRSQPCLLCGATGDIAVAHNVPVINGGPTTLSNVYPACKRCNSKVGTLTLREYCERERMDVAPPEWMTYE